MNSTRSCESCERPESNCELIVFFSTANWRRLGRADMTLRRRIRVAIRHPRRSYFWFLSALVRVITRSRLAHCSIGHDGAVLDPSMLGNRYWPMFVYISRFPTLAGFFRVPIRPDIAIGLDKYPAGIAKPAWPTILKWWTGGMWPTTDCVCVVRSILRDGGIETPRSDYSPQRLWSRLAGRGYPWTDLSTAPDGGAEPTGTTAGHGS